jgi:hypothetical protein
VSEKNADIETFRTKQEYSSVGLESIETRTTASAKRKKMKKKKRERKQPG